MKETAPNRFCFIHVGTHKTGTTSIQRFLALNSERLASLGVLLPRSGCDNGPEYVSHHQLAYELIGDPRFEAHYGGLDALADELRCSEAFAACVSSENLSFLWNNPAGLLRLRDALAEAGFVPRIIFFVRPQASYCSTVYAQIVCNGGYRTPFAEFMRDVLAHGQYRWNAAFGPPLDYTRLIDPFTGVFGRDAVIVRRYRTSAPDNHLLREFAGLLLGSSDTGDLAAPPCRENGSLDFDTVLRFLRGRPSTGVRVRFSPLNLLQVLRFGVRFRKSNAALARYAVKLTAFEFVDVALASPVRRSLAKMRALAAARRALKATFALGCAGARDDANTCYLLVGTQSAGTTALGRVLAANDRLFAQSGLLVPRSGRNGSGHHNIAWELNGDARFDPAVGTLADLLAEVSRERPPRVCLSSAQFEPSHTGPQALRTLADGLQTIGYRTVAVVYLHPQAEYAESLYAELVRDGLAVSFDAFIDAVVASGEFRTDDGRRFAFDYEQLLDALAAVLGHAQIVARRGEERADAFMRDFLPLVGACGSAHGRSVYVPSTGAEPRCADVLRSLEGNVRSRGTADAASPPSPPAGRFDPIHLDEAGRITGRFNAGNKRVYERYGALVPCVSGRQLCRDFAAAAGFDPASRSRKRRIGAHARALRLAREGVHPHRAERSLPKRQRGPLFAPPFERPAALEGVIAVTAAGVASAAFVYGTAVASTALVEFALLSVIVALGAAGWLVRYAVESRGVLADYRFFDALGARLSVAGYGLVGLYAILNAVLDIGLGRYEPDWICYPATVVTAAAALIVTAAAPVRRRLVHRLSGVSAAAGMRDDRFYLACCYVALFVQVAHAVVQDWWMDTAIDVLVFAVVAAEIMKIRRESGQRVALHS